MIISKGSVDTDKALRSGTVALYVAAWTFVLDGLQTQNGFAGWFELNR